MGLKKHSENLAPPGLAGNLAADSDDQNAPKNETHQMPRGWGGMGRVDPQINMPRWWDGGWIIFVFGCRSKCSPRKFEDFFL